MRKVIVQLPVLPPQEQDKVNRTQEQPRWEIGPHTLGSESHCCQNMERNYIKAFMKGKKAEEPTTARATLEEYRKSSQSSSYPRRRRDIPS